MNNSYARAYTEVLEIISHFSDKEYSKIPKEKIEFYKAHKDKNYMYKINPEIDISNQEISREAGSILIGLFRDYFSTEKQREILKEILKQNQLKLERKKAKEYNLNNI